MEKLLASLPHAAIYSLDRGTDYVLLIRRRSASEGPNASELPDQELLFPSAATRMAFVIDRGWLDE